MADQLETRVPHQVQDVLLATREEIVETDNIVAPLEQPLTQMAPQKPRTARHQNGSHESDLVIASIPVHESLDTDFNRRTRFEAHVARQIVHIGIRCKYVPRLEWQEVF